MADFHSGRATTLVATDVAARGIHVDDVSLVVHADPPSEHKAYLHRSGRTARAGAEGTVVTLMTDDQVREVRSLTRAAGVRPTTTRVATMGDAVLRTLAPGERSLPGGLVATASSDSSSRRGQGAPKGRPARPANGGGGGGGGRNRRGKPSRGTSGRSSGRSAGSSSGRPHSAASFSSRAR
jgi:superfamily II DNA/RNA helicase